MTDNDHGAADAREALIRLGISSCLLGNEVRYDGGHKKDHFLTDTLGRFVEYVPVCPEVECGLGIPREAMRLVGNPASPRLVTIRSGKDHTALMTEWALGKVAELERENLVGFIFKSRSPSSGMERVKVYNEKGMPSLHGVGIFASIFMDHFSLLPAEEEGRLHDPALRENFIERIFTLKRWRETVAREESRRSLVAFHTRHKLLLLAHSPKHYREMGSLVGHAGEAPLPDILSQYVRLLVEALRFKATPAKHTNVLEHMMGYFKKRLSGDEKQELLEIITLFRKGHVPLIVPVTLVNHYVRKYDQAYLKEQYYLNPHPIELRLRNHV
jgi:uncharacterized protein YbgA (DUF1722 family)/uncharacterized protein YbbK (DUF523 family)